jgi:myo-inositol-1(or 4)-monophosphatase
MAVDPDELLAIARDVALRAGALLRDRPDTLVADAKSTPTDAVTIMDRASERLILAELTSRRPGDAVLAEESGASGGAAAGATDTVTWVVDPLDGTVNYLYGLPQFAVSIAAQTEGSAVAGVVYDVARDDMYAAVAGAGATINGVPLRCNDQTDLAFALVATGFGYSAERRARQADVLRQVLPRVRDIRRFGSAALDLCAVASGRVDAYFEEGMQPWDWAAGTLIAREAGALVGGVGGRPPGAWTMLAANPALFAALDDLLLQSGAGG